MQREIKFRAWVKEDSEMKGYMITHDSPELNYSELIDTHNENGNTILMQYTGLTDKNGKEIYEGDVLEFPFEMGIVYVINDGFRFAIKSFGSQTIEYESEEVLKQTKIIGNIYENPEFIQSSE